MKPILCIALLFGFAVGGAKAQTAGKKSDFDTSIQTAPPASHANQLPELDDVQQLRSDVQRLKVLLDQMRTNLAFVQTSQSPLKHQFELEADAWQIAIEQMDRRLRQMKEHTTSKPAPKPGDRMAEIGR